MCVNGILKNAGTDRRTRTHAQLWTRREIMEKTGSYRKDRQLRKRRAVMGKKSSYGKYWQLWKRQTVVEKTGTIGHKAFKTIILTIISNLLLYT